MKRRTKKLFSLLLSLALVVGMIPAFGVMAQAEDTVIAYIGTTVVHYSDLDENGTAYGDGWELLSEKGNSQPQHIQLNLKNYSGLRILFPGQSLLDVVITAEGENRIDGNGDAGIEASPLNSGYFELGFYVKDNSSIKINNSTVGIHIIHPNPAIKIVGKNIYTSKMIISPYSYGIYMHKGRNTAIAEEADPLGSLIFNNIDFNSGGSTECLGVGTAGMAANTCSRIELHGFVGDNIGYNSDLMRIVSGGFDSSSIVIEPIEYNPYQPMNHTISVTFNANGGSGSMPDMTVADGGWLKFPECTFTPPAGATFAGWKLSYRDSVYDPGNSVTIYQDTIYYAIWKGGSVVSNDFDTHYVNTGALNMRAKPDTGSERIGGLKKGDLVMLLDSDGEWFQISYRGLIGWVQNKYLDRVIGGWEYPFTDITEGTFDYVPILWAYNAKPQVTNGITSTRFGPKETVTRGQCVTFLWRAMGEPEPKSKYNPFVDVPESQYYYKPILWAVEKGITKGTDKNHFSPDQKLSTAHIITFLYRTLGKGSDGWYQEAGNWASSNGLLDRTGLTVSPDVECPRGAVVTFLYRTK